MTRAVRGAAGIESNEQSAIHEAGRRLVEEILERNNIREADIISILFSLTKDLTKGNPATGLRSLGFGDTPLFCIQEADIEGSLPRVLRVLVTYSTESAVAPVAVYLGRAAQLRPDLSKSSESEDAG